MKKQLALFSLVAAALIATPVITRAQDASTNQPAATAPAKKHGLQYKGKVVAVDTAAKTITVGKQTYNVTATTKINKDGKPATLADFAVGDAVAGGYKKDGEKLNATTIHNSPAKKKAE